MSKMTMWAIGAAAIAVLFASGYFSERAGRMEADRLRVESERLATEARDALRASDGRVRVGVLLGQALMLGDLAARGDYGQAQAQSSRFFDMVREEASAVDDTERREALMEVLGFRDAVTAAVAKNDPAVVGVLAKVEQHLRAALTYPVLADRDIGQQGAR